MDNDFIAPDGSPLSQIVDLIASILSLRFSTLEIQNLCEMRSCLNAHESQYLSRVFLSRQPVANISLQWTFSRTKLIWLALFGKGHRLSAKGYGVTLKAAVSSLHPSTFLARKWNLADALCSCAHRLTGSHRIAKAAWLKIVHSVVATVTIIFGNFNECPAFQCWLVLAFYPPPPPILVSACFSLLADFHVGICSPRHGRGKMSNSSHGSGVFWKPMSYLTSSTLAHSLSLGTLFSREKCHNQRNIEILMYNIYIYIGLHITYGNQSKGPCRKF